MATENPYKLRYETAPALLFIERKLALYDELKKICDELCLDHRLQILDKLTRLLRESRNEIDHYECLVGETLDIIKLSSKCENQRLAIHEAYETRFHVDSCKNSEESLEKTPQSPQKLSPSLQSLYETLKKENDEKEAKIESHKIAPVPDRTVSLHQMAIQNLENEQMRKQMDEQARALGQTHAKGILMGAAINRRYE